MREISLQYCGFVVSWHFYGSTYNILEGGNKKPCEAPPAFGDIAAVLKVLHKYELLFPRYVSLSSGHRIGIDESTAEGFCIELQKVLTIQKEDVMIDRIGGYGYVYLSEKDKAVVKDLIYYDQIRLSEQNFRIATSKSVWIPIAVDIDYKFNWQINLSKINAPRLENALSEINGLLNLSVEPSEEEEDKDRPIWIKGFKLYPSAELLKSVFEKNPPDEPFNITDYLI